MEYPNGHLLKATKAPKNANLIIFSENSNCKLVSMCLHAHRQTPLITHSLILGPAFHRSGFLGLRMTTDGRGVSRCPSVLTSPGVVVRPKGGVHPVEPGSWKSSTGGSSLCSLLHHADPFRLQPRFTYPGACRVYDFSLSYFCCRVFSRASQPHSQSSQ